MRVIPTLIGLVVLVATLRRATSRRAHRTLLLVGGLGGGAVLLAYGLRTFDLPSLEEAIEGLSATLGGWTYVLVALLAFLETGALVGLIVPGETAIIVGGILAGEGAVELLPLILVAWLAAMGGDTLSFLLGRRLGRPFLLRHGPRVRVEARHVERAEQFFERHGGKAVAVGRFIGVVRAVAPFLAGAARMRPAMFFAFDIPSAGAWVTLNVMLGYAVFASVSTATNVTKWVTYGLLIGAFVLGAAITARKGRLGATPLQPSTDTE